MMTPKPLSPQARIKGMLKNSNRHLVGYCGVDSGLIFIGDPCYFKDCEAFVNPDKWTTNTQLFGKDSNGRHISVVPKQFISDKMGVNKDYDGYPMGVITPTNYGDGNYPVYITKDSEGNPLTMTIEFVEDSEDDY